MLWTRRLGAMVLVWCASACGDSGESGDKPSPGRDASVADVVLEDVGSSDAGAKDSAVFDTPDAPGGFVRAQGQKLVDGNGKPLELVGVNLGGWLMWEGWLWGAPVPLLSSQLQAETHMLQQLELLVGAAATSEFRRHVYDTFIGEADIQAIAKAGMNVVRVPVNHRLFDAPLPGTPSPYYYLDRLLSWAEKHQVYVILDLHAAPGGQSPLFTADPDPTSLWDSSQNLEQTRKLWGDLAARYRDRQIIAGYDLLNEPDVADANQLVLLYQSLIQTIRAVDKQHLIVVEGADYARDFSMFNAALDSNMVLSFHMYTWLKDDRVARLEQLSALSASLQVPLWAGEFGENTAEMIESTRLLFEQYGVSGWAVWPWKKVPLETPKYTALVSVNVPSDWYGVARYLATPFAPKPTAPAPALAGFVQTVAYSQATHSVDPALAAALGLP